MLLFAYGKLPRKSAMIFKGIVLTVLLGLLTFATQSNLFAQAKRATVKGVVIDAETKAPLPRASVSIPALRVGAVTDAKGAFSFEAPAGTHTLEVRFVGYEAYTTKITLKEGETRNLDISLKTQSILTSQIVVVGLTGEVDRNALGNTIASVSGRDVANVVSPSAIDAISGRVPGVFVTRNSGTPGAGTYITMRGRKSILGSSEPLYVVDGIVIDNTSLYDGSGQIQYSNRAVDINPQDIESIEILKGASAAAIYGSQAANGVILITTKRGKLQGTEKPAQITYTSSYTMDRHAGEVPLQRSYGQRVKFTEGKPGSNEPFRTAYSHEQSLTISGGVPQFDYLINGTYARNEGYVIGSLLERTSVRANIGAQILPGFNIKSNNNYIITNNDLPQDGSNTSGILLGALRTPPEFNNKIYLYPDGSMRRYGTYDNPIWTQKFNKFNSKITRFLHSTDAKWQAFDWLSFNGRVGYDRYYYQNNERLAVGSAGSPNRQGSISDSRIDNEKINLDFTANLQTYWLDNQFFTTFVLGGQIIWDYRTSNFGEATSTIPFFDMLAAGATRDAGSSRYEKKTVGTFAQLTNTWLEKLSLTLALRRDGSSTFGEAEKFHYYPKVSGSYVLSNESFWTDLKPIFSNVRLRASWGEAGSPTLPDVYATNFLYGVAGFFDPWGRSTTASRSGFIGIKPGGGTSAAAYIVAGAKDINPELTIEREFGIDITLFENLLTFEATYYKQNVFDMILNVPVPTSTGYDRQLRNAAEMWNEGIELSLKANPISTFDFNWVTTLNYSHNRNKVTKMIISPVQKPTDVITLGGGFVGIQNVAMVGHPLGVFYGYGWMRDVNGKIVYSGEYIKLDDNGAILRDKYGRVTKTTKDDPKGLLMEDDYGNPFINTPIQDPDQKIIGNSNPKFLFSWRNDFTVMKNFTFGFLFDAAIGFDVWNGTRGALYNFGTAGDTKDRDEPWINFDGKPVLDVTDPNNPKPVKKMYFYRQHSNGFNINEPFIEEGSYIKLREVSVEYRWDGLKQWNIQTVAFTFSARNLLTITDYKGYDPEVNTFALAEGRGFDYFTLPQVRSYRFGISIMY